MSLPRLLAPDCVAHALYHCVSRVVDRRFIFGPEEKEHFLDLVRRYERLCGVCVLTYCLMDNHFHLLVEVPRRPAVLPTEEELIARIEASLGADAARSVANCFSRWRESNNTIAIAAEMERWFAQMWDLGRFMKMVKQRFSCWYNRRQPVRRTGTLWEERYRSTLVESGGMLQATAFYVDLNPVRAGITSDPATYRWCGYAAATAGVPEARAGLTRMAALSSPSLAHESTADDAWVQDIASWYRLALYESGNEVRNQEGVVVKKGFSEAQQAAVRDAQGNLPLVAYLSHRVRYFTEGAILGSKAFVDSVFTARREWFSEKRRSGARRLKGLARDCPLRCARALRVRPFA